MLDFNINEEETLMLVKTAKEFAQKELKPFAAEMDHKYDPEIFQRQWKKAAEIGLLGAVVPEEYGGSAAPPITLVLMIEELAACDAGFAVSMGVTWAIQSMILTIGSSYQEDKYLPMISSADGLPAAGCLTEPAGGSDVESVERCGPGSLLTTYEKNDGGFIINGTKNFITNGGIAGVYGVLASSDPQSGSKASSLFAIPGDAKGIKVARIEDKMGMRSSMTAQIIFENVHADERDIFGHEGEGVELVELAMSFTRGAVGALAIGIARAAYETALEYARSRVQGGKPIIEHQAIGFMLADMATKIEAARTLAHKSVWMSMQIDRPLKERLRLSSMAKAFCSDVANQVATDALQIFGGYGYMKDYPLERHLRDVRVTQIFEGTNQVQMADILERL